MTNERQEAFDKVKEAVAEAKRKGYQTKEFFRRPKLGRRKRTGGNPILRAH